MRANDVWTNTQRTYRHLSRRPIIPPSVRFSDCYCQHARNASTTSTDSAVNRPSNTLSRESSARFNELGIQQLSSHVHSQLFKKPQQQASPEYTDLSKKHLERHDLLGKTSDSPAPVSFDLPELRGTSLDEHFTRLGRDASEPYLTIATRLAHASRPSRPRKWARRSGWTKYRSDGTQEAVETPQEEALTFDTEVMWKETSFPAMACAVSATHWYSWMSPWLLGESDTDRHLIPLGDPSKPRVIVGHNIGYDRARIRDEYSLTQSKSYFMDTMSLHVAVNGMCTRQRGTWMKYNKARDLRDRIANSNQGADLHQLLQSSANGEGGFDEEEEHLWIGRSSVNSLRDVAKFHCGVTIDKARREWFGELDRTGILEKYDELLDYCAADVDITHRVYKKVFPAFMETCPHPVSFAALRHLSSEVLPIDETWEKYINDAESTYEHALQEVSARLQNLTEKALDIKDDATKFVNDPWLSQLDWSGQEVKMTKPKKKGEEPRPVKRQKMPGKPKWYKDLFTKNQGDINLTVRTRVAPLLLRMAWDGHPLVWSDVHGWTFKVPRDQAWAYLNKNIAPCDMSEEKNKALCDDSDHSYFKLPHKDGPTARCASPLAKGYLQHFENGTLSSEYPYAKEALEMNASCSYWISSRERIRSQMTVYESDLSPSTSKSRGPTSPANRRRQGYILPQLIPMGTITRRAVENTWLTASNAKKNRVGSELKSMIKAPVGYAFVGADVDSEELWIASLMGDAQFKQHGGNALGFMTLEGEKAAGTDLHSRTAKILGISRNDAKVFNYGRIYGAGLSFAQTLLKQFNPLLTDAQVEQTAQNLYKSTKGQKTLRKLLRARSFWRGGTESLVFNALEDFAEQDKPRTPVLGAGITEALLRRYISKGEFMTSRVNWAIQSSGVDYLHLLIVSMDYLIRQYGINARLSITVHDEIRYLVKEEDKYRAAMALQVANVWTRAMFAEQVGIYDLPQSCAYFSAVDIDHVLRKEVDMDCITPSHKTPIPSGESLGINELLAKGKEAHLDHDAVLNERPQVMQNKYEPREPVMAALQRDQNLEYLRAQIANDDELKIIIKDLKRQAEASKPVNWKNMKHVGTPKQNQPQGIMLPEVPWAEEQRLNNWERLPKSTIYSSLSNQTLHPNQGRPARP